MTMTKTLTIILLSTALASSASAKPPLRDVAAIDNALFDLGVANLIRENCNSISARLLRAYRFVNGLERKALEMGYTQGEIDAYVDSDAEKNRLRARAARYFAQIGADPNQPDGLCALGRAEIDKSSRIGSFLRAQ